MMSKGISVRSRWARTVGLVMALAVLVCAAGLSESVAWAQPVQVRIGHATWVGYGPLYIAKEKGFFDRYGLDVELVVIEDEAQYGASVLSGRVHGLANVIDREIVHHAQGVPIQVVFAMDESYGGDGIVASADIKTVADLAGKTVGLDKASTSYFFFLAILEDHGVDEAAVRTVEMGSGDAGAAFVAGQLDAAVTWEPWLSMASQRPGGHVLVSSREYPGIIVDVLTLRQDFIEAHPEAVVGLTKAWNEAVEYYRQNPEEGARIMAKALDLSLEEFTEMAAGVRFYGKDENLAYFQRDAQSSVYQIARLAQQFWLERGVMEAPVDLDVFITDRFVKEASR